MDKPELLNFIQYISIGDYVIIVYGLRQRMTSPLWFVEPLIKVQRVSINKYKLLANNELIFGTKDLLDEIYNKTPDIKRNKFSRLFHNTLNYKEICEVIDNLQNIFDSLKSSDICKIYKFFTYDKNVAVEKRKLFDEHLSKDYIVTLPDNVEKIRNDREKSLINNTKKSKRKI